MRGFGLFIGFQRLFRVVMAAVLPSAYFTNDSTTNRYYTDDAKANQYYTA